MSNLFRAETNVEHRKSPRKQFKLRIHFKCLQKGDVSRALDSLAEDLGAGGMAMNIGHEIEGNQLLMITLFLPKVEHRNEIIDKPVFLEKECDSVAILSRVVWCAKRRDNEYIAGVEFLDLKREHRNIFKKFLIDFDLDKPDSKLYLT